MSLLILGLVVWTCAHLFKRAAPGARSGLAGSLGAGPSRAPEGRHLDLGAISRTLESFVRALDLRDLTLVLHGLGGPVGLGIAPRLHDRIRALIVAESFGWPLAQDIPQLVRMREDDLRVWTGHSEPC